MQNSTFFGSILWLLVVIANAVVTGRLPAVTCLNCLSG